MSNRLVSGTLSMLIASRAESGEMSSQAKYQHRTANVTLGMAWKVAALCTLFVALYGSVVAGLVHTWLDHDRLDAFLIPFISGYVVWVNRHELRRVPPRPSMLWGLLLSLSAGCLLVLGEVGGLGAFSEVSLIVMLAGLILLLSGTAYLKALSFSILFLSLMLSLFQDLIAPLHWPFQVLTAEMSVKVLHALGVPVLLEGHYVVLPNMTLEVARVCSGANYLVSIIAIGLPLTYLALRSWWYRIALLFSAIAIGVMANWARVSLIALLAYTNGEMTHGPFHVLQGMFVAWIGYVVLFAGAWGLSRLEKNQEQSQSGHGSSDRTREEAEPIPERQWNRAWIAAMSILASLTLVTWTYEQKTVALPKSFEVFPKALPGWAPATADDGVSRLRLDGIDHELMRTYRSPDGTSAKLYVAYFADQRQGKEVVNYQSAVLHDGATAVQYEIRPGRNVTLNQVQHSDRSVKRTMVFWYHINGRIIANAYLAKIATLLDALRYGRTDGALIVVTFDSKSTDRAADSAKAGQLVREVIPILESYLP